ncbi:uncharacterized protein HMPREF1541_02118 [Cyphellophora europaea CBS 101466]|uniref:Glucose-methanol-choline oxidoreductase N-terminal domain-containing protein n=1 Tax=Cyphellophora europaea (strain CBS 101466) TaxID=1220924 RepID=W2S2Z2_CYPE1|nr:uncharacterized protein HMPREF1541_02118 [Cyphellophora europaea CBS 101466]ETN42960.1 hypothetical protein HMPREF1541_02118 [Cyphellophora europaea CBS 101466]
MPSILVFLSLFLQLSCARPILDGVFDLVTGLTDALGDITTSLGLTDTLSDVLSTVGLGEAVANPLLETIESTLKGNGLIDGTLGALAGTLGVEQEFDYVVVGGGTAGNAVGVRLAEAGYTVAIVEAGLFYELGKPILGTTPAGDIIGIGSSALDQIPTVDWGFLTEPQDGLGGRRIHYAQGKTLGGSSALNFMIHHRGSRGSYQMWADMVGDQSYTYDGLEPYFKRSVTLTPPDDTKRRENASTMFETDAFSTPGGPVQVGYTNWVSVWATWLEKGMQAIGMERTTSFSSGNLLGYHYSQSTIRGSDQTRSSSTSYINAANDNEDTSEKLKVFTSTQARKVLFSTPSSTPNSTNSTSTSASNKPRATGVEVSGLAGLSKYTLTAKHEVILSAGAFQSPHLLMHSGLGPATHLVEHGIPVVKDLPGVGQNMWDHVMFGPTYSVKFDTLDRVLHDPIALTDALTSYITTKTGPLTSNVVEFLGWEKLSTLDSYRANFSASTLDALASFPADWPEVEHISGNGYIGTFTFPVLQQPLDGKQYATILGGMVAPLSRGTVTLKSANPLQKPAVDPRWLTHPADQEVAVAWYRRMREVWRTPALQSIIEDPSDEAFPGLENETDEEILEVVRRSAMTVWHASGTCTMGREADEMAVVDTEARVFGVQGLRVVDSSIMPVLPPGHPQSTIYALAEKAADMIIKGRE